MKKIIYLLIVLLTLAGCTTVTNEIQPSNDTQPPKVEPSGTCVNDDKIHDVIPAVPNTDTFAEFTMDNQDMLYEEVGYIDPGMLVLLGVDIPDVTFDAYGGETVNTKDLEGKPYIIEFMAPWCGHCQDTAKNLVEDIKKSLPDVDYLQVFYDTNSDTEVNEFYAGLELPVPTDEKLVFCNDDFTSFLKSAKITSIPSFIFVDACGRVGFVNIGAPSLEDVVKYYNYIANKPAIYSLEMQDGHTLYDYLRP